MGGNDDRESWAPVPGLARLWASNFGQVGTLRGGGGFNVLVPHENQYGEPCISFKREGGGHKKVRLVAGLVLEAHGRPRVSGCRIGYRDNDPSNVALDNLLWEQKGRPRAETLTKRRCLGQNCGATFMSSGAGNRLCSVCANRVKGMTLSGLEGTEASDLPDEPLVGGGFQDR